MIVFVNKVIEDPGAGASEGLGMGVTVLFGHEGGDYVVGVWVVLTGHMFGIGVVLVNLPTHPPCLYMVNKQGAIYWSSGINTCRVP